MGRPTKTASERRTRSVTVGLTETEYQHLQTLAGHGERVVKDNSKRPMPTRQRSIAGIIRQALLRAGNGPTATNETERAADVEERKALTQIAGMARNLNQLATRANAQGYEQAARQADALADKLRELINRYDRKG